MKVKDRAWLKHHLVHNLSVAENKNGTFYMVFIDENEQ